MAEAIGSAKITRISETTRPASEENKSPTLKTLLPSANLPCALRAEMIFEIATGILYVETSRAML